MNEKIQIAHIRQELIGRIHRTVEKENGCIGTYFKNKGKRLSDADYEGAVEYDSSLNVGIDDHESLTSSRHETMTIIELFIRTGDNVLCCALKPDCGVRFDAAIDVVTTDCLPKIVDWLVENGFDTKDEEVVLYCSECGRTDVLTMAWVKPNEGKAFDSDIGGNDDPESNRCESCDEHVTLLTHGEMLEQVNDWWEQADTDTREKITNISLAQFDGGEIPAYESACQAYWDALTDEVKIAQWQKWKE